MNLSLVLRRSFSNSATVNSIKHVTVIGGGLMGSGIAQVAAQAGHEVTIIEKHPDLLKKADSNIITSLSRVAKKLFNNDPEKIDSFIKEVKCRINGSVTNDIVKETDLVIEAVIENLELKQDIFIELDKIAPEKTIFTSNTSSLLISDIARVTNRKDRFGGLHFFSPVPVMKLLEVIRIPEQSEETYQALMAFGKKIGKTCITCKDTPGFVVNRLLLPYQTEAIRMLERGDATAEDIDTAMKLGAGYPMGPFELADYVGIDIGHAVIEGWHKKYPDNPIFTPTKTVRELVAQGKLGIKTGEGFHKYKK